MKYYYNKSQPNIEYGMLSGRKLNNPRRKPNADGLVTYYYTSVKEPLGGTYYRYRDYYIIPTKVTPEAYAAFVEWDRLEHNNNHKHDERLITEQEKTAKRVKMTSEQFMEERFIPKVAPILKKRNKNFMAANNVYIFDENADIEAGLKKLFGEQK